MVALFRRRRKERHRAKLASHELDLDFDTTDVEFAAEKRSPRHARGWSESSADSTRPLMKDEMGRSTSPASVVGSVHSSPQNHSIPLPTSGAPTDPQRPPSTADSQLRTLVSRPSFLTRPRSAPRPGQGGKSHNREASNMRATLLTRLASTRTGRRSRSTEPTEEDSPKSLYSQYSPTEGNAPVDRGYVPPVPAIPPQFIDAARAGAPRALPPVPPPPQPELRTSQAAEWRHDPNANNTLDSNPFSNRVQLEDSQTYRLPSPTSLALTSPRSPRGGLFAQRSENASPTDVFTPIAGYVYPIHPAYPAKPSHLATEVVQALPQRGSSVMNVRTVNASRDVPEYKVVYSEHAGESGTVGYQLPPNWRSGEGVVRQMVPVSHVAS